MRGFWRHRGGRSVRHGPFDRPWLDGRGRRRTACRRGIAHRYPSRGDLGPPARSGPADPRHHADARPVAERGVRPPVDGRDDLGVRQLRDPDRPAVRRDPDAPRRTDRGRRAAQPRPDRGARRRVRGGRVGRPAPASARADLGRPRPGRAPGQHPGRGHRRLADAAPGVRGIRARRGADDVLRRRRPGLPPDRRRSPGPRARQRRPGGDQLGDGVRRLRHRRVPRQPPDRADRDRHRRPVVPGVRRAARLDPASRAAPAARVGARAGARRDPRGPSPGRRATRSCAGSPGARWASRRCGACSAQRGSCS